MKFLQLIEDNMRNIFLQKLYTKFYGETIPRLFLKNQNWEYLCINSLKFCAVCSYCMPSWGLSKYIETKLHTTWVYLIESLFKSQNRPETSLPPIVCMIFKEKYFSCYILLTDQTELSGSFYFVRYWAICVLQLFVNQVVTSQILNLTWSF